MKRLNQTGSHLVGVLLLVLVLGLIGFAGYKVMNANKSNDNPTTPATKTAVTVPASITNTATLNQAANALDNSGAQLNSSLDDSQLNSSMNDML